MDRLSSHHRPAARNPRARALLVAPWLITLAALGACTVGPDYRRPDVVTPERFREAPPATGDWKFAEPRPADATVDAWAVFADPRLSDLVAESGRANQSIVQADANYRASVALVRLARSALFPTVGVTNQDLRVHQPGFGSNSAVNEHSLSLTATWEPDLWGGVRRSIESARATADASDATLAGVRLSIAAQIAQDYLALRVNDDLHDLLADSVEAYSRALRLTQSQLRAGTVSRSDVALATAQLQSTRALLIDTDASRALYEHAIAVLVGRAPEDFTVAKARMTAVLPAVPTGLPSALLERRPDIAVAERQAAAANAQIGVAKAAYYPQLTLAASGGDTLGSFGRYFTVPGRIWSLGATLAETLFDGGARGARTDQAIATFDAQTALYRQTVLAGFQDVEDNLATLRVLEDEQAADDAAVAASRDAERIALAQYRAGTTTYFSVITAQTAALTNARLAVQARGRRYTASVALIRAIGGSWTGVAADVDANLGANLGADFGADLGSTDSIAAARADYIPAPPSSAR